MKYIQSQDGNIIYQCLGVHRDIVNYSYSDKKDFKISITHGYGAEEYCTEIGRYSSQFNLDIVFENISKFLKDSDERLFECPKDADVHEVDYSCVI